jgi:chemotaxis protein CheZ
MGPRENGASVADLYKEVSELATFITRAKAEIAGMRPNEAIGSATDELDAIVQSTEEATNAILDAAERVDAKIGASQFAEKDAVSADVVVIFEACNFQDLTGQRIAKVVKLLKHIEGRVDALVALFGPEFRAEIALADGGVALGEDALLNGPQLPSKATTQDDIDALFGRD